MSAESFMYAFERLTEPNPLHSYERVWQWKAVFWCYPQQFMRGDVVWLASVRTLQRGQGHGTQALGWLIALAQAHGVVLAGVVQPCGQQRPQLTKRQLTAWYKRHGFTVKTDGHMYKKPMEVRNGDHTPRSPITKR